MIAFACGADALVGTLDPAAGDTGLLIASGGNEIRCGAHRGMALLAADLAGRGYPVFRYDRRGIGDSTGDNRGFLASDDDLHAAVAAFRAAAPALGRIVAFGNCDAASTLALFGRAAGIDRVLLANPWIIEDDDGLPPRAAIRARYRERLRHPRDLIRSGASLSKLFRGLRKLVAEAKQGILADRVIAALAIWGADARIVIATRDATALAFLDAAKGVAVDRIETDSHSFARGADAARLRDWIVTHLR